ncbi:MAG: UDP-2,4-diacetamido-2,4,6-trideoxy-beta-L-altropyranose hydrolase [Pseudomonadota bacterium]
MKIVFRADASLNIGSGHVMRCLTLAETLRGRGAEVSFICREHPGHLCDHIEARGFPVARLPAPADGFERPEAPPHADWLGLPWSEDAQETTTAMGTNVPSDWLVVDHYALDRRWEQALRPLTRRLMVIDDLADRPHDCDLLLDQNLYEAMEQRYLNLTPPGSIHLLGPRHALLREEFSLVRGNVRVRADAVRRLLVFLGGMDADNATGAAIQAIARLQDRFFEVDVVIGATHPHRETLLTACEEHGFHAHVQTSDMAGLMLKADLAIGAGGGATWERCALGLPTLALCLADNQRPLLEHGSRAGLLHAPAIAAHDIDAIARHLRCLLESPGLRHHLARTGMQWVDGLGAARVARRMGCAAIHLRPATLDDAALLHAWRNHPTIRAVSRRQEAIAADAHRAWLETVLHDPARHLLIGLLGERPVGTIRFDVRGHEAEVSIHLDPERSEASHGLGSELLAAAEGWMLERHPGILVLRADVLGENAPSHRLFTRAGYTRETTRYIKKACA